MELHGPATRAIRERSGYSVTALAKKVGCTQGHLSAVEGGIRKASPELIISIARELKVELPAVLRGPLDDKEVVIRERKGKAAA